MRIIDANVFVRYITGDDAQKQQRSEELIRRVASGQEEMITTDIIIHEVCFILTASRHYNLTHKEARARLYPLIQLDGLKKENKSICLDALDIFAQREYLDYSDAVSIAMVRNGLSDGIYSFDSPLDNIEGANRIAP